MGFFNFPFKRFPYTNFHEINMDWILQAVKTAVEKSEEALTVKNTADTAAQNASEALTTANNAKAVADGIAETANYARRSAEVAVSIAEEAKDIAEGLAVDVTDEILGNTKEYAYPPMELGLLYRTMERYRSHPVYCGIVKGTMIETATGDEIQIPIAFDNATINFANFAYSNKTVTPLEIRAIVRNPKTSNLELVSNLPYISGNPATVSASNVCAFIARNSGAAVEDSYFSLRNYNNELRGDSYNVHVFVKFSFQ